ncbi:MAG: glycosyltransferase [Burkholderiales bacterium]|nr:glycosyltransferase [Burkholderiales bacterium]
MTVFKPVVSVIIPSYNCERYIGETIGSILNQTFRDLELIVVDDGSTDRTQEIVQSFGEPVRLVTQTNSGVCAARNRGIAEAKGAFICLMDHDDYWFPDKLARQLGALQDQAEAGVVYSPFIMWHPCADGSFPAPSSLAPPPEPDEIDPEYSGWIYHHLMLDCIMLTSSAMFRKEVFEKCGAFDLSLPYSEDWELWLRIAREYPFIKLRQPSTLYRQHPKQGNRLVRSIDYRTVLLTKAARKWGLCSRDGRCVKSRIFHVRLAGYHADFGLHHLQAGHLKTAIRSFLKAWVTHPTRMKYLAYIAAGLLGWKPKW